MTNELSTENVWRTILYSPSADKNLLVPAVKAAIGTPAEAAEGDYVEMGVQFQRDHGDKAHAAFIREYIRLGGYWPPNLPPKGNYA